MTFKNSIKKNAPVQGVYSQSELDFIIANFNLMNLSDLASTLQRSYASVQQKTFKMLNQGLLVENRDWLSKRFTAQEDQFIRESSSKLTLIQVSEILGRHKEVVLRRASSLGISYLKAGIDSPTCKLSNDDVELIRELFELGLSFTDIADKFEVSSWHVSRIIRFEKRLYLDNEDYNQSKSRQRSSIDGRN